VAGGWVLLKIVTGPSSSAFNDQGTRFIQLRMADTRGFGGTNQPTGVIRSAPQSRMLAGPSETAAGIPSCFGDCTYEAHDRDGSKPRGAPNLTRTAFVSGKRNGAGISLMTWSCSSLAADYGVPIRCTGPPFEAVPGSWSLLSLTACLVASYRTRSSADEPARHENQPTPKAITSNVAITHSFERDMTLVCPRDTME
jgi:hypothetical protein